MIAWFNIQKHITFCSPEDWNVVAGYDAFGAFIKKVNILDIIVLLEVNS